MRAGKELVGGGTKGDFGSVVRLRPGTTTQEVSSKPDSEEDYVIH